MIAEFVLMFVATAFGGSFLSYLVQQRWYTPKLRLTMQSGKFSKMTTDLVDSNSLPVGQGQWIRLCVENVRYGTAKACRAFLVVVQSEADDHKLERLMWDCVPLAWSNLGCQEFDLPTGIRGIVDIVMAQSTDNNLRPCFASTQPVRYANLFAKPGKFGLVITIGADNCEAVTFTVRIRWTGQWDQIEILNELCTDAEKCIT